MTFDNALAVAMGPVVAGHEADDGGRWAGRRIMAVRRHDGRGGRPLDVLVEWEGEDSDGDLWDESWVSVTYLSRRTYARKRESSKASYLAHAGRGLLAGEPRGEMRRDRDRREKGTHNSVARDYEIGREGRSRVTPQLSSRNRGLTDGCHRFQHSRC